MKSFALIFNILQTIFHINDMNRDSLSEIIVVDTLCSIHTYWISSFVVSSTMISFSFVMQNIYWCILLRRFIIIRITLYFRLSDNSITKFSVISIHDRFETDKKFNHSWYFFWKLSLFYKCDNFECIVLHFVLFVIMCNFFLITWSFYWFRNDRMRTDHAFSALIASDLFRVLALIRSQSMIYRIDQTIRMFETAVFVDRLFCSKCFLLVSSMRLLSHWTFQKDK